jgi:hypothetical protein
MAARATHVPCGTNRYRRICGLGQCSGMTPEEVRLDLAAGGEFVVVCRSLERTDP